MDQQPHNPDITPPRRPAYRRSLSHTDEQQPPLPDCPQSGSAGGTPLRAANVDPSLLDTLQTSVAGDDQRGVYSLFIPGETELQRLEREWAPELDPSQNWIHSGWAQVRKQVHAAMVTTGQSPDRIDRFRRCATESWVYQSTTDHNDVRVVTNRCGDRLCLHCGRMRSARIRDRLHAMCEGKKLRFVTLTLSGKAQSLTEMLDRLYRHFRQLRQHDIWADNVDGGIAFLEVKWSEKAKRWHPHLHCLITGRYMSAGHLSQAWHAITGDSFIVDIQAVDGSGGALKYVTKYASKPLNTSFSGSPDLMNEAVIALKGRRLASCFGDWYGTPLNQMEDEELYDEIQTAAAWSSLGSLADIIRRAEGGDEAAAHVITKIDRFRIGGKRLDSG